MAEPFRGTADTRPGTPAIVAAVGGLIAAIGVFLNWASLSVSTEASEVLGQQLPATSESQGVTGLSHWTGILALVAAIVAIAAAVGLFALADARTRRTAAIVAAAAGGVALVMGVLGFVMRDAVLEAKVPSASLEIAEGFAEGFGVEGFRATKNTGLGVYVTMLGGLVALIGGVLAMRSPATQPAAAGGLGPPTSPPPPPPAGGGTGAPPGETPAG